MTHPQTKTKRLAAEVTPTSGPSCSKLTTLLVNVSLKFQTAISEIGQYFLLQKM